MNTIKCGKCNNTIPQESAFCSFCGTKVERPCTEKACPKCNQMIPLDSEFCPFCGTNITHTTNTTQKNLAASQENSFVNAQNKKHYDFTNLNHNNKISATKKLKKIKLSENETVIMLGDIRKKTASILFWIYSAVFYVCCFLLFYFTHKVEYGKFFMRKYHYFLGFICYMSETRDGARNYDIGLLIVILICAICALLPFLIFKRKQTIILQNELILTDHNVYYYSLNKENPIKLPLESIKAIENSSCIWLYGTNRIIITLNNNTTHEISGVSNAQEFIQACIQTVQNSKDN